jgi:hypothetical protein
MKTKLIKQLKTKSGEIIEAGRGVVVKWDDYTGKASLYFEGREKRVVVSNERLHKYISEAREPMGMEELEDAVNDGVCESILGERVEPDGHDEHGSPSWLLSMGMI